MRCSPRYALNLFGKITQRSSYTRYASSRNIYSSYADPVEVSYEKDDLVSWTSKISDLVRKGKPDEGIGVFKMMLLDDQRPNVVTVLSVLRAVDALSWGDMVWVMHGFVIKMGCVSEAAVSTTLISLYSMRDMGTVWKLFYEIPSKDVILWSAMVSVCVKNGYYAEAFGILRDMQNQGLQPNPISIVNIIPACAGLVALSLGKEIHGFSIKRPFYDFNPLQNSLVDMYAKCRALEASLRVFERIGVKDLISWRTVVRACIENDCPHKALNMFSRVRSSGVEIEDSLVRDMISVSLKAEDLTLGQAIHCHSLKSGFLSFVSIGTSLLGMYAKLGEVGTAEVIFHQLNIKDVIAWTAMISAYSQHGDPLSALRIFKMMQSTTEKPNEITLVSLLEACCSMGAKELGESIHAHVVKSGFSSNSYLTSALVNLYCISGKIKEGKALFDEVPMKDLICWSSMIKGYETNGCGSEALQMFSDMLNCGLEPNEIVFLSVLSACSQCGLEEEGWMWFRSMEEKHGIVPKLAHYACMVDLLSRRGHIEEAINFVEKMPLEPDKRIWGALLAGFKQASGSAQTAEFVVEKLTALDPHNTSYYEFLRDLYAEEGRLEDVERIRKLMDEKSILKAVE